MVQALDAERFHLTPPLNQMRVWGHSAEDKWFLPLLHLLNAGFMSRDRDYSDRGQTKQNPDFWILAESGASLPCGLPRDSLTFAADSSHWCNALRCRPLWYQRAGMCQGGTNYLIFCYFKTIELK